MKSGFITLIGRPNAGKSTLLNALVASKVAIISDKPQTTRNQIRGIYNDEDSQLIFVDTPGIHKPQHQLGSLLNKEAYSAMAGGDLIYYLVDATVPFGRGDEFVLEVLKTKKIPVFLVLNKMDLLSDNERMDTLLAWSRRGQFAEIVPVSALTSKNVDELIATTKTYMEEGPQYYPPNQICDYPEQFIISEIIREKVLNLTHEEVPHSVAVVIERIGRKKDAMLINAMILVERDSQKGIMIGKGGSMIRQIGIEARKELEPLLATRLYLELFVRVEKDWRNKPNKLKQLGYIEPEDEE